MKRPDEQDQNPTATPTRGGRGVRVGLTIGLDRVVAVELKSGVKGPRAWRVHTRPLEPPADDGFWPDLTEALAELRKAIGSRVIGASVALRRPIARIKVVSVPALGRRDLRSLITRNARRYFLVGSEPVQADVMSFRRGRRGETVPALAVCADRKVVQSIERCFAEAGIPLDVLTAAPLALTEAVCRDVPAARQGAAIIAVDGPGWAAGIAVCRGTPRALQPWTAAVNPDVDGLLRDLRDCFDDGAENAAVTGVVLATGEARSRIVEAVEAVTGERAVNWAELDECEPDAVAAVGANLVTEQAPLLLTEPYRRARERRIRSRIVALGVAAAALFVLMAGLYRVDLERELNQVVEMRRAMASVVGRALEMRRAVDAVRDRLQAVADVEQTVVDWTPTLASLAQALPDSAYLLSMTAEGIELRLAGLAASASTIVPALEASPFLNNVSLTVARRAQGAMDSERFDVAALLNPEMIRRPDGTVFERDQ